MTSRSYFKHCHIVTRMEDEGRTLFNCKDDGSVVVSLEGYLICPLDMFTKRQMKAALKKFHARRSGDGEAAGQ